jgi:DNA replication protein DnaC
MQGKIERFMLTERAQVKADSCPGCHGTGWEYVEERFVRRCRCQSAAASTSLEQLLKATRIPPRYAGCELTNYCPQGPANSESLGSQRMALLMCKQFIKEYPAVEQGLLLVGPVGVGKTHLAVSMLKDLTRTRKASCLFYDFRDLLKSIQDSYNPVSQTTEQRILSPVYEADVLVLDELGAAKPTAWTQDTMTHIITTRYNNKRTTIFTTNYTDAPSPLEESLTDRVGERLRSRLYEMCKAIQLLGNDYRKRQSV